MRRAWLLVMFAVTSSCATAAVVVPGSAGLRMGSGSIVASGDVRIAGRLDLGSGRLVGVGGFHVDGTGTAVLGSGLIQLAGDWTNAGSIDAGSSQVRMIDGSALGAAIFGSTAFANLSIVSAAGKRYLLQSGLTQSVAGLLELRGTATAPLQLASTTPGQVANLNLLPSGSQNISAIGVSDVHATGQHLAPNQTNQGGSGNAVGWFGAPHEFVPVPGLSTFGQLLLGLTFLVAAFARRRLLPRS